MSGHSSAFLSSKEYSVETPSLKSDSFEYSRVQIDAQAFCERRQNICESSPCSPYVQNLQICHSHSLVYPQIFPVSNDCRTLNAGQYNLNSASTMVTISCSLPMKPGATSQKGIHKVIERERRRDMKALYSLLRSLLPEKYLQGKRSIADLVMEAVNYIQDLHRAIKELAEKRDKMRMRAGKLISSGPEAIPTVKINFLAGSVLQVSTNTLKNQIVYSDLLLALEEEGLEIFSAVSSAISDKVFHTIHVKVMDANSFQTNTLYHKIWHLIMENMADAKVVES